MIFLKRILMVFTTVFCIFFSSAQDELDDIDYLKSEDIACEDLPEAFNKYQEDSHLNQVAFQKALAGTAEFLKKSSKEGQFVKQDLLKMIQELEEVSQLSMDNSLLLSNKANDISYSLTDCLNSN